MRTYRTLPRTRLLAVTGAALTALALTACEDGTGMKDEGAGTSRPTSATASTTTSTTASTATPAATTAQPTAARTTAQQPAEPAGSAKAKPAARGAAPESRVSCNGSNTTVTAQPVPRPLNHMLITVKNTGSKTCDLTYYPVLRFDEMQWAPQAVEDSRPQAVTTLAPGESGYAGVLLAAADGSGDGGTTGHKLTVGFQGRTPNSNGGPSAIPSLPAKGVYYDSSLSVTYWLPSMEDALSY